MVRCRVLGLAFGLVFLLGCAAEQASSDRDPASEQESSVELGVVQPGSPEPGGQAPDFALRDMDREIVRLSDFRGKTDRSEFLCFLVCPLPCEMPLIQDAHLRAEAAGYVVLGIAVQDSRGALRSLSESMGLTFSMVLDGDNSVGIAYHVVGPPATFFIDENGKIISVVAGTIEAETLEQELAKLLG